eukprot:gene10100-1826_t
MDPDRLSQVRQQVEFYLGESNLSKDRFFKQELASNGGYVSTATLLKCTPLQPPHQYLHTRCNRLKALDCTEDDIYQLPACIPIWWHQPALPEPLHPRVAQALSSSDLVSTEPGKVIPKAPVQARRANYYDERTLYVEFSPGVASVDGVRAALESHGAISYISLPSLGAQVGGRSVGYAFVEFEEPSGMQKAASYLSRLPCPLPCFRVAGADPPGTDGTPERYSSLRAMPKEKWFGLMKAPPIPEYRQLLKVLEHCAEGHLPSQAPPKTDKRAGHGAQKPGAVVSRVSALPFDMDK